MIITKNALSTFVLSAKDFLLTRHELDTTNLQFFYRTSCPFSAGANNEPNQIVLAREPITDQRATSITEE